MYRFSLAAILIALLAVVALPRVSAVTTFADIRSHEFRLQIESLVSKGIVRGYGDGTFWPDHPITRAEFLKILLLSVLGSQGQKRAAEPCFTDFRGTAQWYWREACLAQDLGIVRGYPDGTFRGQMRVTVAEALKMSAEAWKMPLPLPAGGSGQWYEPYIALGLGKGIFASISRNPSHLLTRAEAAALLIGLGQPIATVALPSSPRFSSASLSSFSSRRSSSAPGLGDENFFPLPLQQGVLHIEQLSGIRNDAAAGAKNVPLLAFDALAGQQDLQLLQLIFEAEAGSLAAGQHYRLFADTDGDRFPDAAVSEGTVKGGKLVFSTPAFTLRDGIMTRLEVRANFRPGGAGSDLALRFATADGDFVRAKGIADGRDLSGIELNGGACAGPSVCRIAVVTRQSPTVGLTSAGTLYATKDTTPVPSRQILLGAKSDVLLRLRLRAAGEALTVTDIAIDGVTASVGALELTAGDSTRAFALASGVQCETASAGRVCARSQAGLLDIPKDGEKVVLVRALLRSHKEGGVSGEAMTLSISADASSPAVKARGQASQSVLSQNDGNLSAHGEIIIGRGDAGANAAITGSTHDTVAAKIVSITNGSADPDRTAVPSGASVIGRFRFRTAPTAEGNPSPLPRARIQRLVFTVNATGVEITSGTIGLFHAADAVKTAPCTASALTGTITVTCDNLHQSAVSTVLDPGSSIDLGLSADISQTLSTGTRILQATLGSLGNRTITGSVIWDDGTTTWQWTDIGLPLVRSTLYRS